MFISREQQCPIQRLMIIHLSLAEVSTDKGHLDEDASNEELGEQILYYYCKTSQEKTNCLAFDSTSFRSESAVRFSGLVTALYTLPATLGSDDVTHEIHLSTSTLVFIPLEEDAPVVAVAQVPRLSSGETFNSGLGRGNPLAIRQSVRRSYRLFCLLRGGGIHKRMSLPSGEDARLLAAIPNDAENNNDQVENKIYLYPGMNRLFRLRKRVRKLKHKQGRLATADRQRKETTDELAQLEKELQDLAAALPIRPLREALYTHFNSYLGDMSLVAAFNGGSCRCLVETIPSPIPVHDGLHFWQCSPFLPRQDSVDQVNRRIQALVQSFTQKEVPSLLGVAAFFRDKLLRTNTSTDQSLANQNHKDNSNFLSAETCCLLMAYTASHSFKIQQHKRNLSLSSRQNDSPLRIGRRFKDMSSHELQEQDAANSFRQDEARAFHELAHFLHPPLLAMMSASDEVNETDGPSGERVWAPRVHLPLPSTQDNQSNCLEVLLVVLEIGYFSFLLFIYPIENFMPEAGPPDYRPLLSTVAEEICDAVASSFASQRMKSPYTEHDNLLLASCVEAPELPWHAPGQDVIFVDRLKHSLTLYGHQNNGTSSNYASERSKRSRSQKKSNQQVQPTSTWPVEGLDCRHLLASHLPLDSMLAFDDVMNDVYRMKNPDALRMDFASDKPISQSKGIVEICTSMPQGWIYAFACEGKELYILFDSSLYVTVVDVQTAADKVKREFFDI